MNKRNRNKKQGVNVEAHITHMNNGFEDLVFTTVNYILLAIFGVLVAYPLYYILIASVSSGTAIVTGRVYLFPVNFTIEGYLAVFRDKSIMTGYTNSLFYMIVGTVINIAMTLIAAYPLARRNLPGKGIFMFLFTFTMYFSGGLVPQYLLIRNLGMIDTRWVMIIPSAVQVWNMIITRTFLMTNIPEELRESAMIDGADDFQFFFSIVLPLSKTIIAVIGLFYAIGHWNAYFNALIYLNSDEKMPLQMVLRRILVLNELSVTMLEDDMETLEFQKQLADLLKYSVIVVASIPVLIIYPFIQKYFIKGIMIGSLKG